MAIKLNGVKCEVNGSDDNSEKIVWNDMFNGGCRKDDICWLYYQYQDNPQKAVDIVVGHCREAQADTVFMFLTAVLLLVSGVFLFLKARKGY